MNRVTDSSEKVRFRADRFYRSGGYWYFSTREGVDVGPFESKTQAETELLIYLGGKPSRLT